MNTIGTPRIDSFIIFYNALSGSNLQQLEQVYHPAVVFTDPVHKIQGIAALKQYFSHAYARLQQCTFAGQNSIEAQDEGFLSWTMQFSHPAIGNGKMIEVAGCTVLRWQDGLIIYHRDYYDLNEMVFQHLPVLGWLTDKVKRRMANISG
jgi:limonene-1,2-epoxide hydrolase